MPQPQVIIVTRPGDAGRDLADELARAGLNSVWWPAFEIDWTPSPQAQAAFARLPAYDCVVFVSVSAVAAVAKLIGETAWPGAVAIAAVGAATAAAARAELPVSDVVRIISPNDDDRGESGSEALWPELAAAAPRRVLIARAQHGREWLADKLRALGSEVSSVAVYSRTALPLSAAQRAQLLRWRADGVRTVCVFTSSEAVEVLLAHGADEATEVLRAGISIATYPRIAERLRQLGAGTVNVVPSPAASTLVQCVRSLEFHAP